MHAPAALEVVKASSASHQSAWCPLSPHEERNEHAAADPGSAAQIDQNPREPIVGVEQGGCFLRLDVSKTIRGGKVQ